MPLYEPITVNDEAVCEASSSFIGFSEGYQSFRMKALSGDVPVSGSADHDSVGNTLSTAFEAWSDLMLSDAQDIESTASTLNDADRAMAQGMLGMGWPHE